MSKPAPKPLSGPHKVFADAIFKGDNQTEAYQKAYPNSTMAAARAHAARLVTKGNIKAELARLRATLEKKALFTKERAIELLEDIAEDNEKEETRDRISAMKTVGSWLTWETGNVAQLRVADALSDELTKVREKR